MIASVSGCYAEICNRSTFDRIGGVIQHGDNITCVQFSPSGERLLTASHDKTAILWDASTAKAIGNVMTHDGGVFGAQFSADGKRIVTASRNHVRLWDGLTGEPIGASIEHPDWVKNVNFSPDGQSILTSCADNKARLWDISSTYLEGDALIEHICRHHLIDDQEFTDAELRASMIPDLPRNPVAACLAWLEANR
jgi:WD40 repeat protein